MPVNTDLKVGVLSRSFSANPQLRELLLSRVADAFMTVDENDAISAIQTLANPTEPDQAIVAGESGGVGLAGLLSAAANPEIREALELDSQSRVFLINTEGATDLKLYQQFVGQTAESVLKKNAATTEIQKKEVLRTT